MTMRISAVLHFKDNVEHPFNGEYPPMSVQLALTFLHERARGTPEFHGALNFLRHTLIGVSEVYCVEANDPTEAIYPPM